MTYFLAFLKARFEERQKKKRKKLYQIPYLSTSKPKNYSLTPIFEDKMKETKLDRVLIRKSKNIKNMVEFTVYPLTFFTCFSEK